MANRFWVGGTGNWDAADTTHWAATSNGAGGETVPGASDTVTFDASSGGGTVTITADTSILSLTGGAHTGTLDFGTGRTVAIGTGGFSYTGTGTRTLTLGDAIITVTATGTAWNISTATNLTLTANTATITLSGAGVTFQGGASKNYGGTLILSGSGDAHFSENGTMGNVTRTGTAAKTDILTLDSNMTCSGTFTCNANSDINRVQVKASTVGTAATITAAAVVITNTVDFQDITGAGAATWTVAGTGATALGDCGGNSGITFTVAATQTYTGGTGNWSDVTKWTSRVPLPQDDVLMSGVTGGTITADMPRMGKSIDWTGAAGTPAFNISVSTQLFGSLTFITGMTRIGIGGVTFSGRSSYNITSAGKTFGGTISITAPSGTYTLSDEFSTASSITLNNGGFVNTGNYPVTCTAFASANSNTRTLTMGAATWTMTGGGATAPVNITATGLTFSGASSIIVMTGTSTSTRTFAGAGLTFGTLTYTVAGSTGQLTVTGSNSFAAINFSDATNARTLAFTAGTTTTIRNANGFGVVGTAGKLMTVTSATAAAHTLTSDSNQTTDYLDLSYSVTAGTGNWRAGDNSRRGLACGNWLLNSLPGLDADTPASRETAVGRTAI